MDSNLRLFTIKPGFGRLYFWLQLLALVLSNNAWGECIGGPNIPISCGSTQPGCTYAITPNTTLVSPDDDGVEKISVIGVISNPPGVTWKFTSVSGMCSGSDPLDNIIQCVGLGVTLPAAPDVPVDSSLPVEISGTSIASGESSFVLTVVDPDSGTPPITCSRTYTPHVTSTGGGWGDPHITTVDGVNYDFQSAGEFIALRGKGLEIQTRQTAVSSAHVPGANTYTGIASCVSIYTAVAARVGTHRVTIQPDISGGVQGDKTDLQIRVDGILKTLGSDGIDLSSCDCRITRSSDEKSIEIHYADDSKLVVTPSWWNAQEKWYLNVNVYNTTANEGIMGSIKDKWLPALFNGASVGPRATSLNERYIQLYETFADSWRVSDATSLFDYLPGTSTATFTMDSWPAPRGNPEDKNCSFDNGLVAELKPVDVTIAEEQCRDVKDKNNKANCVFDVKETGNLEFADLYKRTEQIAPGATQTSLVQDKDESKPGSSVTFTATVQHAVSTTGKITSGVVRFVVNGSNVGNPIKFDANGIAVWSTASLSLGSHEVEARFLPSGFGERFRPSSSKVTHVVSRDGSDKEKWWLSFHAGSTTPTGNFSDDYDSSTSIMLDLEYKLTPDYSFLGLLGYNDFKGANTGFDDTYWINLSANIKYYFYRFTDSGRIWVNAGAGAYQPESGSTRAGTNFGVGLGSDINPRWRWEVSANYHNIFTSGSDKKFTTPQVGVVYKF